MIVLSLLGALAACVLLVPTISDLASIARLAFGGRVPRATPVPGTPPRLLFLVPAHDEEALIASCVESLRAQRYPIDRLAIYVIADNCRDRTADLARRAGAECLERNDPARLGKPYGLAWALGKLSIAEFDAVVVVDADTSVDREFARALAAAAPLGTKVVQGHFDVHNRQDNALTRMAAVLSTANHRFAFGLKTRVGINVPLSQGFAIGTEVLAVHGWQAFSIAEDVELYVLLTERGVRTESAPQARIYAEEARSLRQSASQRHRWAAGKLTVLWRRGGALIRSPFIGLHQKVDVIGELASTAPALHLGLVALLAPALYFARAPGAILVAAALVASLLRPSVYALIALAHDPEPGRAALAFSFLPFYTLWRLAVQVVALRMLGDKPWIRTERNR